LYLQALFVKEVERLGLVWACTLKENQPELLREAERLTQESPTGVQEEPGREIRYWHLPDLDWPVADRRVRVVKTIRIESQRRVTIRKKDAARTKGKTERMQPSTLLRYQFRTGSISPISFISSVAVGESCGSLSDHHTDCHLKHLCPSNDAWWC
jgi:hypothetical protein